MPAIFLAIAPILTWITRYFVVKFALAFGFFAISTSILNSFFNVLQNKLQEAQSGLTGPGMEILVQSGAADASSILLSAYSTAIAIKGLRNLFSGQV